MASRADTRRHWNTSWRRGPGLAGKVKEVEQVGLSSIAIRQCRQTKALFNKVNDRRVVHGCVPHVVTAGKR